MELLWVLKASLGFPLRRPEEMSVAGRVSEVHSSLGCAGSAQPGAWQLPGSWGLNEKLNTPPSVLDTWGTSSIPDIPILLFTWHRGPGALPPGGGGWPRSSPTALSLGRWEGEGGHCPTPDLATLGWIC